jgi:hypothetical protein
LIDRFESSGPNQESRFNILSSTRLVLLALWLGAALFFGAVVAPAAFGVLRSFDLPNASEIAGSIVTRTLAVINISGFVIGLFLLLTLVLVRGNRSTFAFLLELVCAAMLVVTTGVGQWLIAARMRALRAAMVLPVDRVAPDDARRLAFNSLHGYSVNALGIAMIASLLAIVLIARTIRS